MFYGLYSEKPKQIPLSVVMQETESSVSQEKEREAPILHGEVRVSYKVVTNSLAMQMPLCPRILSMDLL